VGNKLYVDEIVMISALQLTDTLSWIFIVLAYWNKSVSRQVVPPGHIILIPNQPVKQTKLDIYAFILFMVFGFVLPWLEPTILLHSRRGHYLLHHRWGSEYFQILHSLCSRSWETRDFNVQNGIKVVI